MKRAIVFASALALPMFIASAAYAVAMQWGVFPLSNSPASGLGNPGFCLDLGTDALKQGGFTNIGADSVSTWGWKGGTTAVVVCTPVSNDKASAVVIVSSEDGRQAEYWRNTIRSNMQKATWL